MTKEVLLVTGAGQIGLAIVRRMGYGKKIVIATRRPEKAQETLKTLTNAGFDAVVIPMDMASRESIVNAVILFLERKSIKKNFVFALKRQRFQGFAPGNETKLFI